MLPVEDGLSTASWLSVAELDGQAREARIFLAATISPSTLEIHFADQITEGQEVFWDAKSEAVTARWQKRIGALVLEERQIKKQADPDGITAAMIEGVRSIGLHCLPWGKTSESLRERLAFLHRIDAESWPDVSDAALIATLETWLAPYLIGISRRSQLKQVDLSEALLTGIDWNTRQKLNDLAPTHWKVPTGSKIRIDYSGENPALPVKLTEMYGSTETPKIAGGKVAITLELLSPGNKAIQVTSDLIGFWSGSYAQVKTEMKGRYPKHYWPDDPLHAEPTRRTKKYM
eukprot:gnl/TRDRNA2_/TRDRNA2_148478_c0_seq1.p1 gnl/TRDRNA2_/TRDRNA2_148478_c0~~gnl/TRDRNA2_/TRDRNA2_148478_c0_seq1.p1  ORF type:complete len:307 (+),score=32.80 gnl/TRDRNA2_/TRDRNA2_148478_c0_seq1:57-923(+)